MNAQQAEKTLLLHEFDITSIPEECSAKICPQSLCSLNCPTCKSVIVLLASPSLFCHPRDRTPGIELAHVMIARVALWVNWVLLHVLCFNYTLSIYDQSRRHVPYVWFSHQQMALRSNSPLSEPWQVCIPGRPHLYFAMPRRDGRSLALGHLLLFGLAGPRVGTTHSSICIYVCAGMWVRD